PGLALHYGEGVARGPCLVDDEDAGGLLSHSDLVLVGPAPVIGHRSPAENGGVERGGGLRVGHRGIVHQHDQRLTRDVGPLVIVPLKLRGLDSVPNEDQLRAIQASLVRDMFGPRDEIVSKPKHSAAGTLGEGESGIGIWCDSYQRYGLDVSAVGVAWSQPVLPELALEIGHCSLFPASSRRSTL